MSQIITNSVPIVAIVYFQLRLYLAGAQYLYVTSHAHTRAVFKHFATRESRVGHCAPTRPLECFASITLGDATWSTNWPLAIGALNLLHKRCP